MVRIHQHIFDVNDNKFWSIFGVNILNTAWLIHKNPSIKAQEIQTNYLSLNAPLKIIYPNYKEAKYIARIGSDKTGHWKVIKT